MTSAGDKTAVPKSRPADRYARIQRLGRPLFVVILLYLLVSNILTQVTADEATDDKVAAQEQARSLADEIAEACAKGGQAAAELGPVTCNEASDVKDEPVAAPPDPEKGDTGDPGRGITGTAIVDGRLHVSYTDGVTEDKGVVVGAAGGKGRGVVRASINPAGRLVLSYTDGTTEDAGLVVGPSGTDGAAGADGAPGRSVVSVTVSSEFHLIVSYDDDTTADAGPLPPGPKGEPGRGITGVAFDMETCTATVSYDDGTSEQAPMTGCEPDEQEPDPEPDPDPPPGGLLPGE